MKKDKGFTLLEMMITLSILSVITLGVFNGVSQVNKHVEKIRSYVNSRQELANFTQAFYSFSNKSFVCL